MGLRPEQVAHLPLATCVLNPWHESFPATACVPVADLSKSTPSSDTAALVRQRSVLPGPKWMGHGVPNAPFGLRICPTRCPMLLVMHQPHLHQPWRLNKGNQFICSFRQSRGAHGGQTAQSPPMLERSPCVPQPVYLSGGEVASYLMAHVFIGAVYSQPVAHGVLRGLCYAAHDRSGWVCYWCPSSSTPASCRSAGATAGTA